MSQTLEPVLGEATVQELREAVRGEVITPEEDGYAEAARIWNGMHDGRSPALIVRCAGAADVVAAVGFARSNDLTVAVRGGGHSIAGFSTVDDGLVIDLGPMRHVHVDPEARRAYVGGGAVWGDVDHETQAHGLATTGGLVSTTGVGGFTLGGGIGWLMRKHGLASDNLVGADVVTASGRLVHASETENPELFWGLRGGGGNFGVVTQFELELHPLGPMVYAGPIFYAGDDSAALLRAFREWAPGAPDEITALVNLTTAPPLPVIPEDWHGKKVAAFVATSAGRLEDGDGLVQEFRTVAEPIADLLGPMPYGVIQSLLDPLWPKGIQLVLQVDEPLRARRRPDRRALRTASRRAGAAMRDPRPPDGRRGRPRPRGRDRIPRAFDAVPAQRRDGLARRGCDRRARRVGAGRRRGRRRQRHGPRLQQLPGRRGRGRPLVQPGHVRPPGRAQERVRPDERVPPQPERQAELAPIGRRSRVPVPGSGA